MIQHLPDPHGSLVGPYPQPDPQVTQQQHGHGSSTTFSYQTYYDLLINACVRHDKTKKANIGKRRNVYNSNIDTTDVDYLQMSLILFHTHLMGV